MAGYFVRELLSGSIDRAYARRILVAGFSILLLSFLAGILLSFYEWDRGSPFDVSNWKRHNPVGRATYGPLAFALMLFPWTGPVLLILSVPIYFGIKRKRLWPLSLLGFLSIGLLWLWYLKSLWEID
jgi:hypothetical protein